MPNAIPTASRIQVKVRDGGRCARCGVLTEVGQWHHRRSRSVRDLLTHSAANGVWLCPTDHAWVHANPLLARQSGFIVSRYADPSEVPINHVLFGWVRLTTDGAWDAAPEPRT